MFMPNYILVYGNKGMIGDRVPWNKQILFIWNKKSVNKNQNSGEISGDVWNLLRKMVNFRLGNGGNYKINTRGGVIAGIGG